jgi:hypothetical protein
VCSLWLDTCHRAGDFPRMDVLKMDIEGAETSVFGEGDTSLLAHTTFCAVGVMTNS